MVAKPGSETPGGVRLQVDTVTLERSRLETMRRLREFERKIQRRVLRKGARAGGAILKKGVQNETPKVNKTLQRSVDVRYQTFPNGNVAAVVGQDLRKQPRKSKAKRPRKRKGGGLSAQGKTVPDHLVALRTKSHRIGYGVSAVGAGGIGVLSRKVMRWGTGKSGGPPYRFSMGIRHRGTKGNNYLEQAYFRYNQAAKNAVDAKITVEVDAEAAALGPPKEY